MRAERLPNGAGKLVGVLVLALLSVPAARAQFAWTNNHSAATITAYSGPGGAVTIPATLSGLPVTSIGSGAFAYATLTSVTIPAGVTNIGDYAFYQCTHLGAVTIPDSVSNLGESAFNFCPSLTNLALGAGITNISATAFYECASLPSLTLPNSVQTLGDGVFSGCAGLTNITLGSGVVSLGTAPFGNCYNLLAINTAPGNPAFVSVDGVLFDLSHTTLLAYPAGQGGTYTVPGGVTIIASYAFADARLYSVTLPASLQEIREYAFAYTSLTNVVLPGGLTSLGNYAFTYSSLNSITIPNSLTNYGVNPLGECASLTNVVLAPGGLTSRAGAGSFFTYYGFLHGADGGAPAAGLVLAGDGNFYGTTSTAGAGGKGTVFRITPAGNLTTLHGFTGAVDGANPAAALLVGKDGLLYGTTCFGGATGNGLFFALSTNGTLNPLHSFAGSGDGANPEAPLIQGADGTFYGTTGFGTTNGDGTVFRLNTNGTLGVVHVFKGGADGASPVGELVQGTNGALYGTTSAGGAHGAGTIFELNLAGDLTTLYPFGSIGGTGGNALDGSQPYAGLSQGRDGDFYGTTAYGGTNGLGTIFKMTPAGVVTTLHQFGTLQGANSSALDGANPAATLIQGADGNFYGTALAGGAYDSGTVFSLTPSGVFTLLYAFTGGVDGASPNGLIQAPDGSFWGTAYGGGLTGSGTVFRLTQSFPAPRFQRPGLANGTLSLTWTAEPGGVYQLQYTTNLNSPNWTDLGPLLPATSSTLTATDTPSSNVRRFYRLARSR